MGTALVDAIESAKRFVSDLLPGWTSVDFLMLGFGLSLVRAAACLQSVSPRMSLTRLNARVFLSFHSPDPSLFHGIQFHLSRAQGGIQG